MGRPSISTYDLIGQKFGELTVVSWQPSDGTCRGKWVCLCSCGKEVTLETSMLVGNKNRKPRVGCVSCTRVKQAAKTPNERLKQAIRREWGNYKNNARNRGVVFSLSEEEFSDIVQKNCEYCGSPPSGRGIYMQPMNGVDRVDNDKPYDISNCAPCCGKCNHMKKNLSVDEFTNHIIKIYENINKGD